MITTNDLLFYFCIVNHGIFLRRQPFLDFVCEIMRCSPCGKYYQGQNRYQSKLSMKDVEQYLDPTNNAQFYNGEIDFLVKQCKRKYPY